MTYDETNRADEVNATERGFRQAREHLVVKESAFVQHAKYSLNRLQAVTLMYLISKIQPSDEAGKTYRIDFDEFLSLLRWTDPRYNSVKDALRELSSVQWWMKTDKGKEKLEGFIEKVQIDPQKRYCSVKFSKACYPYLYGLRERNTEYTNFLRKKREELEGAEVDLIDGEEPDPAFYTAYRFEYVAVMDHRYSPRLYELLKSYVNMKKWTFELGTGSDLDLHQKLAMDTLDDSGKFTVPKTWSNWAIFKRDVLEKSVKEINELTDLYVSYKGNYYDMGRRKTKRVETICFTIRKKNEKEMAQVNERIEEKYRAYLDAKEKKHMDRLAARKVKRAAALEMSEFDEWYFCEEAWAFFDEAARAMELEWHTPEVMEIFAQMDAEQETSEQEQDDSLDEMYEDYLRELKSEKWDREIRALLGDESDDNDDEEEDCELPY